MTIGESEHHDNYYRIIILFIGILLNMYVVFQFVGFAFKRICKNLVKFAEQIKWRVFYAPTSPSFPPPTAIQPPPYVIADIEWFTSDDVFCGRFPKAAFRVH